MRHTDIFPAQVLQLTDPHPGERRKNHPESLGSCMSYPIHKMYLGDDCLFAKLRVWQLSASHHMIGSSSEYRQNRSAPLESKIPAVR